MKKLISFVLVSVCLLSGTALASETGVGSELEELRRMVKEQNRLIEQLLHRVEALESGREHVARIEPQGAQETEEPIWTDRIQINGDLRLRYEHIDDDSKSDNRNRNRIRARVGVKGAVTDDLDAVFQISTGEVDGVGGGGSPTSGNQTLTNAFSAKDVWVSLAYADWRPESAPGMRVLAGKMKYPFFTPGKSDLLWDGDLNPEGGAIKYEKSFDTIEVFGNAFGFWVMERSSDSDSGLFGLQGGLKKNFTALDDKAYLLGGLSYFDYGNVAGRAPFFDDDGDDFGNTLDSGGALVNDYDLFEIFGEFGFRAQNIPITLFADYVTNTATGNEDDAWLLGFGIGKAREPGSWQFKYFYKDLEKDSMVGAFTDSDFGGGGTDSKGHEINFAYQLARNWQLALSYFHNRIGLSGDEDDYDRFRLDAKLKF